MGIYNRIYSDFLLPSRMDEYRYLLETALKKEYKHVTIPHYFSLLKENKIQGDVKYFIHRHDIDTDPATARAFFEIEKSLNVKTSYYFRLDTFDVDLFKEISELGFEAGYHYEELSDVCKLKRVKEKSEVISMYPEIRERFRHNVLSLEEKTGCKIKSIAAHGDFVNRKLNMPNYSFITDELLMELKIELECYHPDLIHSFQFIGSDTHYPQFYKPASPFEAIKNEVPVIYFLSHPRHWRCNRMINLSDNIRRLKEGLLY